MPDLFYLLSKWRKPVFIVVLLSLVIVGVITFLTPRQYLSVATALPASSMLTDKGTIFNENIEALYPSLGTPDDLERIVGTAQLDTIYLAVTDQFNLYDHYKTSGVPSEGRTKAARMLKQNSKLYKSGYGELKIKVWDTDKNLAPQLANALMEKLQSIHSDLQNSYNSSILHSLRSAKKKTISQLDSLAAPKESFRTGSGTDHLKASRQQFLTEQMARYEKLINEYQLMVDNKPPALMIVEKAIPSGHPDRPKRVRIMAATLFASLLFSIFLALLLERKK